MIKFSQVTQGIDAQRFPWTQHGTMHFHGFAHGDFSPEAKAAGGAKLSYP